MDNVAKNVPMGIEITLVDGSQKSKNVPITIQGKLNSDSWICKNMLTFLNKLRNCGLMDKRSEGLLVFSDD